MAMSVCFLFHDHDQRGDDVKAATATIISRMTNIIDW